MGQTTDEIRRKRQELAYRKGTKIIDLTKKEKRRTSQKVIKRKRREKFIRGIFLALGITIGAGGHALLTAGNMSTLLFSKRLSRNHSIFSYGTKSQCILSHGLHTTLKPSWMVVQLP